MSPGAARAGSPPYAHRRGFHMCRNYGNAPDLGYARVRGVLTMQLSARILLNCVVRRGLVAPRF